MKTQLPPQKSRTKNLLTLFLLLTISASIQTAKAVFPTYGLSTPAATLDPMSGGTITTLINTNVNDGVSAVTSIGFTFNLNGVNHTQFSVNSNGLLRLGSTVVSSTATNSLASGTDLPKMSAYWDDLRTLTGTVRSKVIGSAPNRKLVVDWNVTIVNTSQAVQFQVWLFETSNNIQFVYGNGMNANPGNYSVGIATLSTTDYSSITVASTFSSSTVSNSVVNNSNQQAIASGNSFLYTTPPSCPIITTPAAAATNVPINSTLNWTAGTTGTTSVYDVFFGTTASPPLVSSNQAGTSYDAGALLNNQTYFWRVVGKNGSIAVAQSGSCATNQFTTVPLPACVSSPTPANLAIKQPLETVLSWPAGSNPVPTGYDVYFGTTTNPPLVSSNQAGITYNPGLLAFNTTYYWKVIPRNGSSLATGCAEFQFTTKAPLSYEVTRLTGAAYNSISGTGNSVSSWRNGTDTDDNLSNAMPIGFDFTYDGTTFSSFLVSTNGFITFNIGTSANGASTPPYHYLNSNLTGTTVATPSGSPLMVAPYYDDITCQGQGSNLQINLDNCIKYLTTGSPGSRILTVQWSGMELFTTSGPNLNFQLKLYEGSNAIEFVYGTMETFNGSFNHTYSFSSGINATAISSTPQDGEVFVQQIVNTRSFAKTAAVQLNATPECHSVIRFDPGSYTPYVPVSMVPPNDASASPITVVVNPSPCIDYCGTYYRSQNATSSGGTPTCFGTADDDVWFDFNAINTSATIKISGSGNYDPTVEVFNNVGTSIACANNVGLGLSETLNLTSLTIGQTYKFRVYHRSSGSGSNSSGEFSVCVSATPVPPTNDECATGITLPISATLTPGTSTLAATPSPGIPLCGLPNGENPDDDVWYRFTAVKAIEVITVSGNTGFNAVIQLFANPCSSLTSIACVNSFGNGQVETLTATGLTIGAVYRFRVFHAGIGSGSGSFSVSVSSPPPGCTTLSLPPDNEPNMSANGIDLIWEPIVGADNYIIKFGSVNPPSTTLTTTTDTFAFTGILKPDSTYYWQIIPGNGNSYNNSCPVTKFMTEERPIALNVKVFLQEYYTSAQTMIPFLNPLDTITDTITIHLYDEFNEQQYSSQTLLSTHGWATGYFPLIALDSPYYLVVAHRSSLEVWSNVQFYLAETTNDTLFDFFSAPANVYGGNVVQMQPGVHAMYHGDVTQDGYINYLDVDSVGRSAGMFEVGYYSSDINLDGVVESIDLSRLENIGLRSKRTPFPPFGP